MLLLKEQGLSSGSVNISFKRNLGNATTAATSPLVLPGLTLRTSAQRCLAVVLVFSSLLVYEHLESVHKDMEKQI